VKRSALPITVAVLAAALVGLLVYGVVARRDDTSLDSAVQKGQRPAAPGSAVSLPMLDGKARQSLAQLRGKVVVLNFWASWCEPCKAEAPLLEKAWRTYRDRGLVVLGVNSQDLSSDARRFAKQVGWTYPLVRDGAGDILGPYAVAAFPETFFIDRKGKLVARIDGEVSEDELETNIERALA
jgi:cytochrome c biogenesis protein CcmG, thiol:disulfide interchange protein DsbE